MRPGLTFCLSVACSLWALAAQAAPVSFHLMQIEQVIGGVNGDASAQAIQLRMRFPGGDSLEFARIRAWDAQGDNPLTLIDFDTGVPNNRLGDRILVASPNFADYTDATISSDFVLTNLIPESYLNAGRITYEGDDGVVYWSLSFGGTAYTGPTTGSSFNDADGDFGPPFDGPIPSSGVQALYFQGSALDRSVTNVDDYALTAGPAVFTNNARRSTTLCEIDLSTGTDLKDFALFQACFTDIPGPVDACCETADFNSDDAVDLIDYAVFHDVLSGP